MGYGDEDIKAYVPSVSEITCYSSEYTEIHANNN